jgi:hypothetical protein
MRWPMPTFANAPTVAPSSNSSVRLPICSAPEPLARPSPLARLTAYLRPAIAVPVASAAVVAALLLGPLHLGSSPLPTIDATFYFDEHAAQQAPNPLADRSTIPQALETGFEQSAGDIPDVAAHEAVAATGSIDVVH